MSVQGISILCASAIFEKTRLHPTLDPVELEVAAHLGIPCQAAYFITVQQLGEWLACGLILFSFKTLKVVFKVCLTPGVV